MAGLGFEALATSSSAFAEDAVSAIERAGADVLYAPGLRDAEQIRTAAAEAMRDQGDFSSLASPSRIQEWLAG